MLFFKNGRHHPCPKKGEGNKGPTSGEAYRCCILAKTVHLQKRILKASGAQCFKMVALQLEN
jgi:hypothetical protein